MTHAPQDADRAAELVDVGSRWFGHGHHHTVVDTRTGEHGVLEARIVRDVRGAKGMEPGPVAKKAPAHEWMAAWRIQKFYDRTKEST
jgi:hypothetical protein